MRIGGSACFALLALSACGTREPTFIEAPSRPTEGWVILRHHLGGLIDASTVRDWSSRFQIEDDELVSLELFAYDEFSLPLGDLPPPTSEGLIPRPLPVPDAVFETAGLDQAGAFVERAGPSPAAVEFRYGGPSRCLNLSSTVHEAVGAGGGTSATFLEDGSALAAMGPTHYRATRTSLDEYAPCGLAGHYGTARARADGTHLVLTRGPSLTAILRFDPAALSCEVISVSEGIRGREVAVDQNLSGDPNAPIFALTSSGALSRYEDDGTWTLLRAPAPAPGQVFENRAILLQVEPGLLVGTFGEGSVFFWTLEAGMTIVPLPEPPMLVLTPNIDTMTYVPAFGVVAATDWGPIYQMNPRALSFDRELYDFHSQVKFLVPFGGGVIAFLKEGPAVQIRSDEVCLPGTTVSGGSLLSIAARDDAVVGLYREDPRRLVRWVSVD